MVFTSCVSTKSTEAILDGSGSYGPIVKYEWRQIKGNKVVIPNKNEIIVRIFILDGVYHFELTGWDTNGFMDKDTLKINNGRITHN
jgi:hypothetical protein